MTLDLTGKKAVVNRGKHSVGRAIAETVAREGADVVMWLSKIFGIKARQIGIDRYEAIRQPTKRKTKIKPTLLWNLKSITPTKAT